MGEMFFSQPKKKEPENEYLKFSTAENGLLQGSTFCNQLAIILK